MLSISCERERLQKCNERYNDDADAPLREISYRILRVDNRQNGAIEKLSGHVRSQGEFTGSKARNMHRSDALARSTGSGGAGKVAVMGLLEQHGEVRTLVVSHVKRKSLRRYILTLTSLPQPKCAGVSSQ